MSRKTFDLIVVTPERTAITEKVVSVTIPGADGYLGIWADHAPLMTVMRIGCLEFIHEDGVRMVAAVTNGFVEVADNKVRILADAAELQNEINVERARLALQRARERMAKGEDIDLDRAHAALERAKNRLLVAEKAIN